MAVSLRATARGTNCFSLLLRLFFFFSLFVFVRGYSCPRDLRTAHRGGRRIPFVVAARPRGGSWVSFPFVCDCFSYTSLRDDGFDLLRDQKNKINAFILCFSASRASPLSEPPLRFDRSSGL